MSSSKRIVQEGGQVALALAVSAAISLVAIYFAVPQLARVTPPWLAQSLTTFVVAVVWMWAGLGVAPRRAYAGMVQFIAGALGAAYYVRGTAYSVSAYYGIIPFVFACAGATVSWVILAKKYNDRNSRIASGLVPPAVALVFASVVLLRPTLGFTRRMLYGNGATTREHMIASARTDFSWYMWRGANAPKLFTSDSVAALVETHPGSGLDKYSLTRIDESNRAQACALLRDSDRDVIDTEISEGLIPRWVTLVPYHEANCDSGEIWHLTDIP